MLKSSIIFLIVLNLFVKDLRYLGIIFGIAVIFNIFFNKNLRKDIFKLKFLIWIYMMTFFIHIYSHQEGEVYIKIWRFYITDEGIESFFQIFLRIINLVLFSWLVSNQKILPKYLSEYQRIIENVIELVPEIFQIFRKKRGIKGFLRYILKQIKIKK